MINVSFVSFRVSFRAALHRSSPDGLNAAT